MDNGDFGEESAPGVWVDSGSVFIDGCTVSADEHGLVVLGGSTKITSGIFTGAAAVTTEAPDGSGAGTGLTLADLLDAERAYFKNGQPVTQGLDGTVEVKACTHPMACQNLGNGTHRYSCPACGKGKDKEPEECAYGEDGKCVCGSALAVTLTGAEGLVYTGSAHTPAVTVTRDGVVLTEGTDYTAEYSNNVNAGDASVTVAGKDSAWTFTRTFPIGRAALTADGIGAANGTYGAKLSELTVDGLTAKLGASEVSGVWKLTGDAIPNVGDSGEHTASFTPDSGADNYNPLTAKVKLNIVKAPFPTPQTGTLNIQNGHARDYTYDLSRLLPTLSSGQSFGGDVAYTLKAVGFTEAGYYDSSDPAAISGTILTLPVKAVTSEAEGRIGTITVTISSRNFADVDAVIHVGRVNKQPVSIEGVTAQNSVYNGEPHSGYTGTPTASPYGGGASRLPMRWRTVRPSAAHPPMRATIV